MSNLHRLLSDSQLHTAKGFGAGVSGSYCVKNENGLQSFERLPSLPAALAFVDGNAAPPTTANGDIYVLIDEGNGAVNAAWQQIPITGYNSWVRRSGTIWVPLNPTAGQTCYSLDENVTYAFDGTNWGSIGVSGGKVAIYDANGNPTFYATLTLAFAAATSGSTIQLMTSMTETLTTALTIPFGVNINLNGNTLTINQNNANTSFQTDVSTGYVGQIINGTIKRTNGSGAIILVTNSTPDTQIDFTGLITDYTGGLHFNSLRVDAEVKFRNLKCLATTNNAVSSQSGIENFTVKVTSGTGIAATRVSKCQVNSTSGICYFGGEVNDSQGYSATGNVFQNLTAVRCSALSTGGDAFSSCTVRHSIGLSSSGYGCLGSAEYSNFTSTSQNAMAGTSRAEYCKVRSVSSLYVINASNNAIVKHCQVISESASSSARGINMGTNCDITHNDIKMGALTSYAIGSAGQSSFGGLNTASGCAAVYDPAHTQLTVNTSDSQGNLLK
jgi:hypothetical protein